MATDAGERRSQSGPKISRAGDIVIQAVEKQLHQLVAGKKLLVEATKEQMQQWTMAKTRAGRTNTGAGDG